MKRSRIGLLLVFFLFGISFVSAVTPVAIRLEDCKVGSVSADCSEYVNVSCRATAQGNTSAFITSVSMSVNGNGYRAALTSGTYMNGTWSYNYQVTKDLQGAPITFQSVSATASDGSSCSAQNNIGSTTNSCYVLFSTPVASANACVCSYTKATGSITTANTRPFTVTPSAACVDQRVTSYSEFADYCNPQWTPSYGACLGTFANGTQSLSGYMLKTYTASDGGVCCAATGNNVWFNHNTGSDCTAPIDAGSQISCTEDFWNAGGDTAGFNNITGFNTASYNSYSAIPAGNSFEPLVYDFNGDGSNEIILSSRTKVAGINLWLYSNKLVLLATSSLGGNITGQPTLVGITVNADGATVFEPWISKTQAPILVVPINMGEARIEFINMSGGVFSNMLAKEYVIAGSNGTTTVSGIVCDYGTCYFYADNNLLYSYNYENGTVHTIDWRQRYVSGSWAVQPVNNDYIFADNSPSIAKISSDARYIVVPMNYNEGAFKDGGLFVVSDLDAYHNVLTPVVRYILAPESETQSNQLSWRQVGKVAVSKPTASGNGYTFQVGLSVEETYDSVVPKLKMGVFQFTMDPLGHVDISPNHIIVQSMLPLWKNIRSATDEGISNIVALSADKMAVSKSVKLATIPLGGAGAYSAPSVDVNGYSLLTSTVAQMSPGWVSSDQLYMYSRGLVESMRITDGSPGIPYDTVYNGVTSDYGKTYSEFAGKKRMIFNWYYNSGYGNRFVLTSCRNVDNFFAPTVCSEYPQIYGWGSVSHYHDFAVSPVGSHPPYVQYSMGVIQLDGVLYSFDHILSSADPNYPATDYGDALRSISTSDSVLYSSLWPFSYPGVAASANTNGVIIAYNEDLDVLITTVAVYQNFKGGTLGKNNDTNVTRFTVFPNAMSGAAFNFDWSNPKYIGVNGKKYTINLATVPATIIGTTATCSGNDVQTFNALFYNSDAHILGYKNIVDVANGANNAPRYAYCDFSDDGNPLKYNYDAKMLFSQWPQLLSGNNIYSYNPRYIIRQYANNEGIYDGVTGDWYIAEVGYSSYIPSTNGWGDGIYYPLPNQGAYAIRLSSFNDDLTSASNSTSSSATTVTVLQSSSVVQSVSSGYAKKGYISAGDFNADGTIDIVAPTGFYDLKDLIFTSVPLGLNQEGEQSIPVDLNADGYMDVLSVTTNTSSTNSLKAKLSVPLVNSITQGPIAINNMRCSAVTGTNKVNVQLTAAALSPDKVTVKIDAGDGSGAITSTPQADGTYSLSYGVSGTYTITATVVDFDSTAASKTCSVTIVIPAIVATPACGIGADGEFSYSDSVTAHNWKVVKLPVGQTTLKPGSGILTTSSNTEVDYALTSCSYATTVAETKMWPGSSSGFYIYGTDPAKIIGIQFNRGSGSILNQDGEYLDTYPTDSLSHILSISMNRANGEYKLIMDGSTLYTGQLAFEVGGVAIKEGASWDYVRTTTSGAIVDTQKIVKNSSLVGDVTKLMGCNLDNQQNSNSLVVRTGFNNVNQYCISKGASGTPAKCDYIDLAVIATNYPECSKEAYNYCVKNLGSQQVTSGASVQGGTVCSSLFMISAGVTGIVYPTVNAGWNVFKSNITLAFLIVVILIIFLPIIASKRRGP
jgi:hypothetical protein